MPEETNVQNTDQEMETLLGLENLEDINLDEVEDLPGFVLPPEGVLRLMLERAFIDTYSTKEEPEKKKRRIKHMYTILGVKELNDASEKIPAEGSKFDERWQLTPDGIKYWKLRAKDFLGDDLAGLQLGQALKILTDKEIVFTAKVSHRKSKSDKDGKEYTNVNLRVVSIDGYVPDDAGL